MTALRLLNTESQDKADYLHNQLITDINVPSTYWECAESYLKGKGQILRPTPNTAPLICGACYNTQPEDLLTMA